MRLRRMLAEGVGYYHVISRITGQQFLMNAEEKDVLMRSMFNVAIFSGVEILTFALMDNHFHILVKVPRPHEVDEAELLGGPQNQFLAHAGQMHHDQRQRGEDRPGVHRTIALMRSPTATGSPGLVMSGSHAMSHLPRCLIPSFLSRQ